MKIFTKLLLIIVLFLLFNPSYNFAKNNDSLSGLWYGKVLSTDTSYRFIRTQRFDRYNYKQDTLKKNENFDVYILVEENKYPSLFIKKEGDTNSYRIFGTKYNKAFFLNYERFEFQDNFFKILFCDSLSMTIEATFKSDYNFELDSALYCTFKLQKIADSKNALEEFYLLKNNNTIDYNVNHLFPHINLCFQTRNITKNNFKISDKYILKNSLSTKFGYCTSFATFGIESDKNGKVLFSTNYVVWFPCALFATIDLLSIDPMKNNADRGVELLVLTPILLPYNFFNQGLDYTLKYNDKEFSSIFFKMNTDCYPENNNIFKKNNKLFKYICFEPSIGYRYIYKNSIGGELVFAVPIWNKIAPIASDRKAPYLGFNLLVPIFNKW